MIIARGLHKSYGQVNAVRDLSFTIDRPGVTGLLGPNGAGKSTTIRMLTGLIHPDRGSAFIMGHDLAEAPLRARRALGYAPETAPLYPELTPAEYLRHRARLHRVPRAAQRAAIDREIDRCQLRSVSTRRIAGLSKGYRQRVALAGALVHDPSVVVLDEPASGLDPAQIIELRSLIRALGKTKAVLVSSHILPEIERTCDRVLIIAAGRLLADGSPGSLTNAPPIHATRALGVVAEVAPPGGAEGEGAQTLRRIVESLAAQHARTLTTERLDGEWLRLSIAAPDPTPRPDPGPDAGPDAGPDSRTDLVTPLVASIMESGSRVRCIDTRPERPRSVTLEERFVTLLEEAARDAPGGGER